MARGLKFIYHSPSQERMELYLHSLTRVRVLHGDRFTCTEGGAYLKAGISRFLFYYRYRALFIIL